MDVTNYTKEAMNLIARLIEDGIAIEEIDKILLKAIKVHDRYKIKQYLIHYKGENQCSICKTKENLTMHHIKPISKNKNLEYDQNNIIIMCRECHDILHDNKAPSKARQIFHEILQSNRTL